MPNFLCFLPCRNENNVQVVVGGPSEAEDYHVLASRSKFEQIESVLTDTNMDIATWLCQDCERPLHHLVKYKPPLTTVRAVCEVLTDIIQRPPELIRDKCGFTPLHVACAHGCSVAVIARLINGSTTIISTSASASSYSSSTSTSSIMSASYSSPFHNNSSRRKKKALRNNPAAMKDEKYGRLPLHWACIKMQPDLDNHVKVVGYLVDIYPDGATMEDLQGQTPIDILKKQQIKHPVAAFALEGIIRSTLERHLSTSQQNIVLSLSSSFPNFCKQSKIHAMRENKDERRSRKHQPRGMSSAGQKATYAMESSPPSFSEKAKDIAAKVVEVTVDNKEFSSGLIHFDMSSKSPTGDVVTGPAESTSSLKKLARFHEIHGVGSTASSDTSSTTTDDDSNSNKEPHNDRDGNFRNNDKENHDEAAKIVFYGVESH